MAGPIPTETQGLLVAETLVFSKAGVRYVAVVVKATFAMIHEGYAAISTPAPLTPHDVPAPGLATLDRSAELAPFLPRVDVLLRGHVRAPSDAVPAVAARLVVHGRRTLLDKTVHAYGDRDSDDGYPRDFVALPLVYELARGSEVDNPVGLPETEVPNLVVPDGAKGVACFAAVPATWPARRALSAPPTSPNDELQLADDFDFAFYQAAPPEQQIDAVSGDEWIILDGMHPDLGRFATRLPGANVQAELRRGSERVARFDMICDTIAIDTDERACSLLFRGHVPLAASDWSSYSVSARMSVGDFDSAPTPDDELLRKTVPPPAIAPSVVAPASTSSSPRPETLPMARTLPTAPVAPPLRPTFGPAPPGATRPKPEPTLSAGLPFVAAPTETLRRTSEVSSSGPARADVADNPTASFFDEQTPEEGADTVAHGSPFALPFHSRDAPIPPTTTPPAPSTVVPPPPADEESASEPTDSSMRLGEVTLAGLGSKSGRLGSKVPTKAPPVQRPEPLKPAVVLVEQAELAAVVAEPTPEPASAAAASVSASAPPLAPAAPSAPAPTQAVPAPAPPATASAPPLPAPHIPPPKPSEESGVRALVLAKLAAGEAFYNASYPGADLSGIDFSKGALSGINLAGAKLERCNFEGARLSGAKLMGADLRSANMRDADVSQADLSRASLDGARFDKANISDANFTLAVAEGALFDEASGVRVTFAQGKWEGASFRSVDLGSADFSGAEISRASFDEAKLSGARFSDTRGEEASFVGATLDQATFTGATLKRSRFDEASLKGSSWERATLEDCSFRGAQMEKSIVARATLTHVVFVGAELGAANFVGATGEGSDFSGAKLVSTDFRQTKFGNVSFERADLSKANAHKAVFSAPKFSNAKLVGASFRGAKMKGATFTDADLAEADLRDADLENAKLAGAKNRSTAKLGGANLRGADDETNGE